MSVAGGQIMTSHFGALEPEPRPSASAASSVADERNPFIFQLPATSGFGRAMLPPTIFRYHAPHAVYQRTPFAPAKYTIGTAICIAKLLADRTPCPYDAAAWSRSAELTVARPHQTQF